MAQPATQEMSLRRRHVTRERLLDAASVVLAREGIQGASVEHICERAGYTRGAFYSNFSSKDELIMALFERERDAMIERMQQAADMAHFERLDLPEVVSGIIDRFTVLLPVDRDWFMAHREFELRGLRDDAVGRAFVQSHEHIRHEVERLIGNVLEKFGYRLTVPISHVATLLMGTYDGALSDALTANRELDADLLRSTVPAVLLALIVPS